MGNRIKEIVEGWKNDLIPASHLKEVIEEMGNERLAICRECPHDSVNKGISKLVRGEYCTVCGCPLAKKTKSPTSQCPLNPPKWESYMSLSEYDRLNKQKDNGKETIGGT